MKILVTGVLGVIGSKLEEILKIRGHEVFGVDLYHTSRVYGHGLGKVKSDDYFRCDIGEFRQIEQVIEYVKPDLIYNCAAEFGRWNGENFYEKVWKSNVIGMKHIIRLQEKHGFKLVHCSSSEVYGDYEGVMYEDVLNETPIIQMNDYAMSKRVNEMQIHNSRSQFGTNSVMVRFFNTYGPGEWYHPFRSVNCLFTYDLLNGKPITVFKGHSRTSTYIYDSVRTLANISDNFIDGETYNIASDQEHTIENLAELLVKYTKADASLVDYREHGEVLTTKHKHVDASKSVRDLDHKNTVSLEEGVWETVQWMKEHYRL
jgi:dTDP-glucose 4,6-dehydratase|tara:strand:+ start:1095 stop:2042 length:948 start_codon:yes stop_codon:yes gene_type:complete